jgi:predicted permease
MNIEIKFILILSLIIIPFFAGSILRGKISSPQSTAKKLIRVNLFFLEPLILLWTIWGMKLHADVAILPVAGIFTVITGFLLGRGMLKFLNLKGVTADSYLISSTLANQGMTLGGLICYLIAGEQGLALATIYVVYYLPFVFIFIFPFAKYSSARHDPESEGKPRRKFKDFTDFFFNLQNLPLAAIIAALIFHCLNIQRPDIFFPLDYLLFAAITVYYLTLGINFETGHITAAIKEQTALALSKFVILPLITFMLLNFVNLDHSVETVILIQSFMPAAIYSVISSILFDLDSKLTSGLFVVNSLFFLGIVLPVLMMLRGVI